MTVAILVIPPFFAASEIVYGPPNTNPLESEPGSGLPNKHVADATPTFAPILLFVAVTGVVTEQDASNPLAAIIVRNFFILYIFYSPVTVILVCKNNM